MTPTMAMSATITIGMYVAVDPESPLCRGVAKDAIDVAGAGDSDGDGNDDEAYTWIFAVDMPITEKLSGSAVYAEWIWPISDIRDNAGRR